MSLRAFQASTSRAAPSVRSSHSEERFRAFFEVCPAPSALLSADLRVLDLNAAALATLGNPEKDVLIGGDAVDTLLGSIDKENREAARDALRRALAQPGQRFVWTWKADEDRANGLDVTATSFGPEEAPELLMVWTDISAKEQRAQAAQEIKGARELAARAKNDLMSRMSHELLTPLNGILGMTELLLGTQVTDEQRDYLASTRASARSLLTLVDDLLDFAKADSGSLRFVDLPFSLHDMLTELMLPFGRVAQDKGLDLILLVDPDVPDRLVGDARRVRQVLSSLVSNALKFTGDGEVFVWVRKLETFPGRVKLSFAVTDTGFGIPPQRQAEIFQPFVQGRIPNAVVAGAGLGLAIASRIVGQMGGTIGFESAVGEGSEFRFEVTLPFLPEHAPSPDLGDLHVLVVSHNERHCHALSEMIRGWKGRPRAARDAEGALEALQNARQGGSPVGLLLVDSDLPSDGATRLLHELDSRPAFERLPCIVLASRGFRRQEAHRAFTVRVNKPVLADSLQAAIEGAFSGRGIGEETHPLGPPIQRVAAVGPSSRVAPAPRSGLETLAPMKVLVVDDNPVNRKVAIGLLEQAGHRAIPAEHGCEALEIMDRESFDLALMDVEMPNMDGIDTTLLIRAREEVLGTHLPVVALTALSSPEDRRRCLEAGMDDHLGKPLDPVELVRIVRRLISQPSSEEARPVEPKPKSGEAGPIDIGQLEVQVGGSQDLLRELVQVFLEDVPQMMQSLEASVAQADAKAITSAAHKLKGALLSLAAGPASDLAKRLEELGRSNKAAEASPVVPLLRAELDAVQHALRQAAGRSA